MMLNLIQQLATLDVILSHWGEIRARMGPIDTDRERELNESAAKLSLATSPLEIRRALDDLLVLTEDTPAYAYIQHLKARTSLSEEVARKSRSRGGNSEEVAFPVATESPEDEALLKAALTMTGKALGGTATVDVEYEMVPVYFATNRVSDEHQAPDRQFSGDPSETLTLGLAEVTIPVAKHRTGEVETPAWWNPIARRNKRDTSRYVVLSAIDRLDRVEFSKQLGQTMSEGGRGSILVFLHGYNVTFEEAAQRAAQFSFDMRFQGTVVLFSWPSLGHFFGYLADEDRAVLSAEPLVEFLQILKGGPWDQVHIVAHSMGNRVVVLGLADNHPPALPFGQIVFVAADVPVAMFEQKFSKMSHIGKLKTVYTSKRDRALLVSSGFHRATRVGLTRGEPFTTDGLETIDASTVETSLFSLGHGYFGEKRSVITDLGFLIREGLPASRRGLAQPPGKSYWDFPR